MSTHEEAKDVLSRAALAQKAKDIGVTAVVIRYSGSGDSGQVDEVEYVNKEGVVVDEAKWQELEEFFAEWAFDELISNSEHDGFWNNEGGYGSIDIDFETNDIKWDHSDYIQHTSDTSHHLSFLTGEKLEQDSYKDGPAE